MKKPSYIYFYLDKIPYKLAFYVNDIVSRKKTLEVREFRTYRELLHWLATAALEYNNSALDEAQAKDEESWQGNNHRKNLYISKNRDHLFIQSPDLAEENSFEIGGYWVKSNEGRKGVEKMCRLIASGIPAKIKKSSDFRI